MRLIARLLFILCMIGVYGSLARHLSGDGGMFARWGIVAVLSFVSTLVHELGHAIAVRGVGGRIKTIFVFPLSLRLHPRRLRLAWRFKAGEVGGYVAYEIDRINPRRKHMQVAIAGPLASLLLGGAGMIGASCSGPDTMAVDIWSALALLSAGAGLVNLIPFENSDGAQIARALRPRRGR